MANVKISELPAATTVSGADELAIVQGGVTKRATIGLLSSPTTFILNTYNGPTASDVYADISNNWVDLSDRGGDLAGTDFYNLPTGWTLDAYNEVINIPNGTYSIFWNLWTDYSTTPLDMTMWVEGTSIIPNSNTGFQSPMFLQSPFQFGSVSLITKMNGYTDGGLPSAYIRFWVSNFSGDSRTVFHHIAITRLGD